MNNCKNEKGMTLIEITVVLLISTILLTIVGSILVTSLNFFRDQKISDQNKQKLDGIAEYVDNEIKYASDLAVNDSEPDDREGWHYISVIDGKLYRDGEQVFDDRYYDNYTVVIRVKGNDGYRLDVKYDFDKKGKSVYDTAKSYSFDNLKLKMESGGEDYLVSVANLTDVNDIYRIYYIKGINVVDMGDVDIPDSEPDDDDEISNITVADQVHCINTYNNRGVFDGVQRNYIKGDFVFYDGYWWQLIYNSGNYSSAPNTDNKWKKISKEYDRVSAYEVNDVVFLDSNKHYYKCIKDIINQSINNIYDPLNKDHGAKYWKDLGTENPTTDSEHNCLETSTINRINTVMNKLDTLTDEQIKKIPVYTNDINYPISSWVYRDVSGIRQYYLKVFDGDGSEPGTSALSGWQIISRDWHIESSYVPGDVVYVSNGGIACHIKYEKNIDFNLDLIGGTSIPYIDKWGTQSSIRVDLYNAYGYFIKYNGMF